MTRALDEAAWPAERLGEALEALSSHAGLGPRSVEVPAVSRDVLDAMRREGHYGVDAWIDQAALWLGVEAESVEVPWSSMSEMLAAAAPALLMEPATMTSPPRFFLLVGARSSLLRRGVRLLALAPDLSVRAVPLGDLRDALCGPIEALYAASTRELLQLAKVPQHRAVKAERAILAERIGATRMGGCWLLRADPGESLARQFSQAGVFRRLGKMFALQLALYALNGAAWYVLGRGALQGTLDRAWLLGWAVALLTTLPLQLIAAWQGGRLALDAGALFKQRLLAGAVRLDPEAVRHQGVGGLLGRVIESSAVESGALSGATAALAAAPAVVLATGVLAAGLGGVFHAVVYVAWVLLGVGVALHYGVARRRWTQARVTMTNDLVERMVGHRTRIAQEAPERWHDGEDKVLDEYLTASASLDRLQAVLTVLVPRGWTLLGIAALAPSLASATATPAMLAVSVGAVVLAGGALKSVTGGLVALLAAGIAWREVAPLFHAAAKRDLAGAPIFAMQRERPLPSGGASGRVVVEAHDVVFKHEGRAEPVLRGVSLRVSEGDRILLEGPSGGGKSTLGAVLAGLRTPASGLLLLHGLDARSVGATSWRRKVVTAPQFHENHVMTGTLAFNLLLGRAWPPSEDDLVEADTICRELELGPLLDRMPSGMQQMVGESGWRLSHGEQSRLFMARALLQGADVVVLDESFAALDPETLKKALECALRRCPALMVIAHP